MEKAEISRLINSFNAIKGYFDTTEKYMPQIAKLVVFIEEVIPLFNSIHASLHQSTSLIPSATAKLDKVTSATEMATTEVMDIVDNVISRLNSMTTSLDVIEQQAGENASATVLTEKVAEIRNEINGSQEDLFSIMNALQFQDITTQQINSIAETIENVQLKLSDLLKGFEDEGVSFAKIREATFDPNAEFDFERSAESQKLADLVVKKKAKGEKIDGILNNEKKDMKDSSSPGSTGEIVMGEDGQPDISAIMNELKEKEKNNQ